MNNIAYMDLKTNGWLVVDEAVTHTGTNATHRLTDNIHEATVGLRPAQVNFIMRVHRAWQLTPVNVKVTRTVEIHPRSNRPDIGSRWTRPDYDPSMGPYNGYTVKCITNEAHRSPKHPPQVVYWGDNGHWWTRPLEKWPGNLVPEADEFERRQAELNMLEDKGY